MNMRCQGLVAIATALLFAASAAAQDDGPRRAQEPGGFGSAARERARPPERAAPPRAAPIAPPMSPPRSSPRRPPVGPPLRALPPGTRTYRFADAPYFYHDGFWYRRGGPGYIVTRPPRGAFITVLPPFFSTVWIGGTRYYFADDIYYRWDPVRRVYMVSDPGGDDTTTDTTDDLFIYPKNGQSEEEQATDRYECHRWASDQTNFDPTRSGGGVDDSERTAKRADYQRAQTACLEARGYSVR